MHGLVSLLWQEKFRRWAVQVIAVACVAGVITTFVFTAHHNLVSQGIASGFSFLQRSTGWDISFSLLDYSIRDPYWRVLLIGFLNTLFVGVLGVSLATVFGTLIGMARVSSNFILNLLGAVYVELFRNVPLILQGFVWYAVMTRLPPPKKALALGDAAFLSSRGIYLPWFDVGWVEGLIALVVLAAALLLARRLCTNVFSAWPLSAKVLLSLSLVVLATMLAIAARSALMPGQALMEFPELRGLRFVGGVRIIPEFSALAVAIVVFGSAYIAEIVRGGFLGVAAGQLEAAAALGLTPGQVYWTVRIPLALRAIVPPLSNQYVWLMKATTIGIAIGFSDLFMVVSTSINQSGQTIELLFLMMAGFLLINYTISTGMNLFNRAIALKGHDTEHRQ